MLIANYFALSYANFVYKNKLRRSYFITKPLGLQFFSDTLYLAKIALYRLLGALLLTVS